MASTINAKTTGVGGIDASGDASGVLALQTGGTTAVTIDASQNVGIGTASPARKLEISGASAASSSIEIGNTNTQSSTVAEINTTGTTYSFSGVGGSTSWYYGNKTVALGTDSANPIQFISNGSERMRIDSSGNVGIGATSPYSATQDKLTVQKAQADTVRLVIDNQNSSASGKVSLGLYSSGASWNLSSGSTANNGAAFAIDNGTERMRIDSSGNVGIGSTNPGSYGKLTVNGAIAQVAAAGSYTIDVTANTSSVANGGTIDFPNMSGMIIVNSATSANIAIWLVSGGSTSAVSNVNGVTGTMTYFSGIAGYRWTNNTGSANTVAFFCVRTRGTA